VLQAVQADCATSVDSGATVDRGDATSCGRGCFKDKTTMLPSVGSGATKKKWWFSLGHQSCERIFVLLQAEVARAAKRGQWLQAVIDCAATSCKSTDRAARARVGCASSWRCHSYKG
jgi:hypothetical protein